MPNITPASRITATTTPATATETRQFFGRFDGAVDVVLEATGADGSFTGDVPLDGFKPPLTRAQLDGLAMRMSLPPNEAGTLPLKLVEKNGRTFLRVAIEKGTVSMLMSSPIAIAVGKPELLGQGAVSAPQMMLQLNADTLRVDRTAPTLRMELEARVQDARAVDFGKTDLATLRDGTSSWFGGRQLEEEHAGLVTRVAETKQTADTARATLEKRFETSDPMSRLVSMPAEVAKREPFSALHNQAIRAKDALISAKELRQSFVELSLETELPAQDAKIAELEAVIAAGVKGEADVRALYAKARREDPALADAWLVVFGQLQGVRDFDVVLATAARARDALALNESDTAQVKANQAKNLPGAVSRAEDFLARATKRLAERDARISGLRDGTGKEIVETAPTHAADMKVI